MKLLIDTNVILDMVFKRNGYDTAMELFRRVREARVSAYITASSVTDLFYIIHKETHDKDRTYNIMENIFHLVAVFSVTEKDILDAFKQMWTDFEDCVQYTTGKNNRADYLITKNKKDYESTALSVLTPSEWLNLFDGK